MYSLNVPLPGRVHALIDDLAPLVARLDSPRSDPGLGVKRLGAREPHELPELERRLREGLAGSAPFELAITGTGTFESPPDGGPAVWYLAVESVGVYDLHADACELFEPVPELEGEGYVPHVTLGRGDVETVSAVDAQADVDPVTWTADVLVLHDSRRGETVRRFSLPV